MRNHRTSIKKCSGFYFMGGSGIGHVVHIELEWLDEQLTFVLTRQRLPMESVATKVTEVLGEAQRSLDSTAGWRMTDFTLPISGNFIGSCFGAAAVQVPSGQSVVIINPDTGKVYLSMVDGKTLFFLQRFFDRRPERSVFPESIMFINEKWVFEFPFLKMPLT